MVVGGDIESPAQMFSCEFGEISKNTFFTEHLWSTAPEAVCKLSYKSEGLMLISGFFQLVAENVCALILIM